MWMWGECLTSFLLVLTGPRCETPSRWCWLRCREPTAAACGSVAACASTAGCSPGSCDQKMVHKSLWQYNTIVKTFYFTTIKPDSLCLPSPATNTQVLHANNSHTVIQSHLHLQKGSLLTKGHRQLYKPTEEATQKMAMTQMANHEENGAGSQKIRAYYHMICTHIQLRRCMFSGVFSLTDLVVKYLNSGTSI